jgi:hypothetical protein
MVACPTTPNTPLVVLLALSVIESRLAHSAHFAHPALHSQQSEGSGDLGTVLPSFPTGTLLFYLSPRLQRRTDCGKPETQEPRSQEPKISFFDISLDAIMCKSRLRTSALGTLRFSPRVWLDRIGLSLLACRQKYIGCRESIYLGKVPRS